ncbi:MAG: orotidine-5'-phosphate decarboxylase [Parvibaculales bacterium]
MTNNPVFCAFDMADIDTATKLAADLGTMIGGIKIGMEFFFRCGVAGYKELAATGLPIFLDLKLHDIPNTVEAAVRALLGLKPFMLNVHAGGGAAMMQAAAHAAQHSDTPPIMLAVTLLTSLNDSDLHALGISGSPRDQVLKLAALAQKNNMDGVVCSAHEIELLRAEMGADFKLIVPGIRPIGSATNDQKRMMTPRQAYDLGADVLVIGRPITAAQNPQAVARDIAQSLGV